MKLVIIDQHNEPMAIVFVEDDTSLKAILESKELAHFKDPFVFSVVEDLDDTDIPYNRFFYG